MVPQNEFDTIFMPRFIYFSHILNSYGDIYHDHVSQTQKGVLVMKHTPSDKYLYLDDRSQAGRYTCHLQAFINSL